MTEKKDKKKISKKTHIRKYNKKIRLCARVVLLVLAAATAIEIGIVASKYINGDQAKKRNIKSENTVKDKNDINTWTKPTSKPAITATPSLENKVYTYLQGPKSWGWKLKWSGEWGNKIIDGGSFGGFGCGICCMANIYCTYSDYKCTPLDMYQFEKSNTGYGGGGAVDWGFLKGGLVKTGMECDIHHKDSSYSAFKENISNSKCAIVLVSSYNSDEYWKVTPGHYVTIFLYDKEKEKVFLADSGDPKHNRHWVSLRMIYRSLKTSSSWQYITVNDYNKKTDEFRCKKMTGKWCDK